MVDNLIDELDGRLLRIELAYPGLAAEVRHVKKNTAYAMRNSRDPRGKPIDRNKTLREAVKRTLAMVRKHPELKDFVKPIIKKAVNYLEPQYASADKH